MLLFIKSIIIRQIMQITSFQLNPSIAHSIAQMLDTDRSRQERTASYLKMYHQYRIKQQSFNQFLDEKHQKDSFRGEIKPEDLHLQSQNESQTEKSEIIAKLLHTSQTTTNISIKNQDFHPGSLKLTVEIFDQNHQILLPLNTLQSKVNKNQFNLSNFNSFNVNSQPDEKLIDPLFENMIQKIENIAGRRLTQKGIQKIEAQIQLHLQANKSLKQREIEELSTNIFDYQLNNKHHLFRKQKQRNSYANTTHILKEKLINAAFNSKQEDNITNKKEKDVNKKSQSPQNQRQYQKHKQNQQKINKTKPLLVEQATCKSQLIELKQLRVVRRNNEKNALSMMYSQNKHVEQFCILNKIFGKEKDKIIKAVQKQQNVIYLE